MRFLVLLLALLPLAQAQDVGRLLLLSFSGTEAPLGRLETMHPAGFIFFADNLTSTAQVRALTRQLAEAAPYPLILGVDQEGGPVNQYRADETTLFPGNMALGAAGSPTLAREVGEALGRELAYAGLNVNLAPVADVLSNPDNPIIGVRSFGAEPKKVATLALAFSRGLAQAGIVAVAKHFPGHGATALDSHDALPVVRHDRKELGRLELPPFRDLIEAGIPAVMSAHVAFPALDDTPVTLSEPSLTGLLRRDLGFRGVAVTDALNMAAITANYTPGEAAVRSVQAGADLLLLVGTPEVQEEVYRALQDALESGRLSRARVRQAIARTSRLARQFAPQNPPKPDYAAHRKLAERVAQSAATLLWNDGVLPISISQSVLVVAPQPSSHGPAGHLGTFVKARRGGVRSVLVSDDPTMVERAEAVSKAKSSGVVVLASYQGFGAYPEGFVRLADELAALDTPLVVVSLGRPDELRFFSARPDAYAAVYGYRDAQLQAATSLLLGELPPLGRLPVRAGTFPVGAGMKGF